MRTFVMSAAVAAVLSGFALAGSASAAAPVAPSAGLTQADGPAVQVAMTKRERMMMMKRKRMMMKKRRMMRHNI